MRWKMGFNTAGTFNNSFLGNSSAKPICGQYLTDMFLRKLVQAKVDTTSLIVPGAAIVVQNTNQASTQGAGKGLNPNVLHIQGEAPGEVFNGFLIANETDILLPDDKAAHPVQGQIVNIALFGSGIELYLPCNANVANVNLNTPIYWDAVNKVLTTTAGTNPLPLKLLSPAVDGVKYIVKGNIADYADTKCVRVQL